MNNILWAALLCFGTYILDDRAGMGLPARMVVMSLAPTAAANEDAATITRLTAERDALWTACEAIATIALDCKERWSRGHEARYEAAQDAIEKSRRS